MRTRTLVAGLVAAALATSPVAGFKYKIKDLQIKAAREYASHQDFQEIAIAAYPCPTKERTKELFDTDRFIERGYLPVLIVIENRNTFPIQIDETEIFLVDERGQRYARVPAFDVLVAVALKKDPSAYSSSSQLLRAIDRNMRLDFEHKAFGQKLIAPLSGDHGVVFFRLPDGGELAGYRMYLPTIHNMASGDPLVFFEFDLKDTTR